MKPHDSLLFASLLVLESPGNAPIPGGSPVPGGYGAPTPYQVPAPQGTPHRASGMAVTSMILGIIAICTAWLVWVPIIGWISFAPAALAVVFGAIGLSNCNKDATVGGRRMAITGLVLGIIVVVFGLPFRFLFLGM